MNSIFIVLPILTILMFDLGLTLALRDFSIFIKKPWPVVVGLVGQLAVLPLVAFAVGSAFQLPPILFVGLVLIACCPGGSSSNIFSKLAGGDVSLSVTLTALSSVITLLIASILCGAALSFLFRIKSAQRRTIIIEIGMQNAAQAIAIAASPFVLNDSAYAIPAIIYALLMNVVLLTYVGFVKTNRPKSKIMVSGKMRI